METSQPSNESRVLIIYTGGTIGMLVGQQGYVPEPYFLTETLRSQTRFHDPLQDSLFSNSGSVQGFRDWSSGSGRSTPSGSTPNSISAPSHPTLRVRSTRPIGHPSALSPTEPKHSVNPPSCVKGSGDIYEAHLPSLVTPCTQVPGGGTKRIRYAILEWHPLLDSSNVEIEDWIRIATEVELNYYFDAFVILHGTDTMAYTSSALSFLLEDLGKTVILTGAQIPLCQLRNDAVDNLMGALLIAGHYIIPECCLYFNHTLYRGNRVSKTSSFDLSAFSSPNFDPLVNVGIDIVVNWNNVIRQTSLRRFRAYKSMSPHVATLRLFPGITVPTVRAFLMPPVRGVVLETFGAGNAPQRADIVQSFKEACDRGVVIVAISQCANGSVSDSYETGRTLMQAGVVPGVDMTPECALTKLSYLLSKPELSTKEVRDLIGIPLRGELSSPSSSVPAQPMEQNWGSIQGLLSHFVRLSRPLSSTPTIVVSRDSSFDEATQDATARWSWTAAEATAMEAALYPFLIHMSAAKDDVDSMKFSIAAASGVGSGPSDGSQPQGGIAGGVLNCLEAGSGRSPLHVAALNDSAKCVRVLLESGALVHLRDALGHTALYYAARQGHEETVEILVRAGASLSGSDLEGGFASLAVKAAARSADQVGLRIWRKTGLPIPERKGSVEHEVQTTGSP